MSIRRPLFVVATLVAASVALPALAGDFETGGIPLIGAPGATTNNSLTGTNVAAGTGNGAFQNLGASQTGGKGGQPWMGMGGFGNPGFAPSLPSTTNNSLTGTNVAAGIGNGAFQGIGASQAGAGRGGVVNNSLNGLNLSAGEFNLANQQIGGNQH